MHALPTQRRACRGRREARGGGQHRSSVSCQREDGFGWRPVRLIANLPRRVSTVLMPPETLPSMLRVVSPTDLQSLSSPNARRHQANTKMPVLVSFTKPMAHHPMASAWPGSHYRPGPSTHIMHLAYPPATRPWALLLTHHVHIIVIYVSFPLPARMPHILSRDRGPLLVTSRAVSARARPPRLE
jgi:hypothetical protein